MRWLISAAEAHPPGTEGSPIRIVRGTASFNRCISFCSDCQLSYRSEMLKVGRCQPDAVRAFERSKEAT